MFVKTFTLCFISILLNLLWSCAIIALPMQTAFQTGRAFSRGGSLLNSRSRFLARINALGPGKIDDLRRGKIGGKTALPPGFAIVNGQVMDVTYKVVQRRHATGSVYFAFKDKIGTRPLYIRPGSEIGWSFIVFQDPYYWRGSGHLILLKRIYGINISPSQGQTQILYEAYVLSLRMTLHPRVDMMDARFRRLMSRKTKKVAMLRNLRTKYKSSGFMRLRERKTKQVPARKKRSVLKNQIYIDTADDCYLSRLNITQEFLKRSIEAASIKGSFMSNHHSNSSSGSWLDQDETMELSRKMFL